MFAVTVRLEIAPGAMPEALPLVLENARASLAGEAGCHRFDVLTDPACPDHVFLYELYDDAAAFDRHRETPHYARFDAAATSLIRVKDVATWSVVQG